MVDADKQKHIVAITAVIGRGGKFLVVQRGADEIAYPGKWAFPGGKLEAGQDIMETLRREVEEEAGLAITDQKFFLNDAIFTRPDGHHVVVLTFLVNAPTGEVKLGTDFQSWRWVTPEELKQIDCVNVDSMSAAVETAQKILQHES